MDYEQLLERARQTLPETAAGNSRFEVPKVRGHIQGNKTIISNFSQIANDIGRPIEHFLKYILKELATPGEIKPTALIIGTKISASRINEKIEQYVREFVLCPECKKPDTKLIKEDKITYLKCTACGAKHTIKIKV